VREWSRFGQLRGGFRRSRRHSRCALWLAIQNAIRNYCPRRDFDLDPALSLDTHFLGDHSQTVSAVRDVGRCKFVRSTFVENGGNNPIERKLSFIGSAALTAGDSRFRFSYGSRFHCDQFNAWTRHQFVCIKSAL
jgi:hypothetical protein